MASGNFAVGLFNANANFPDTCPHRLHGLPIRRFMTLLDLPQLMTSFSFCVVGEAFDSVKTVAKPSHCFLLDSDHVEILFLFRNK